MDALPTHLIAAMRLHIADLTPRQRVVAVNAAGDLEALADSGSLLRRALGDEPAARLARVSVADVETELARAERRNARVMLRDDPAWPPLLLEISDPPWALWTRGCLPAPSLPSLVVVGPRRPSPYGLSVARELCRALAELGVVIISGGARGVDGCAHAAALSARAPTVAVLGCGVDVAYPREHRPLFDRIEESGAIVSEHACGVQPRPHHFPVRNRLLAGWARAVLVPEGTPESGSLITARLALEAGRDVMAVPGPITSRLSEGPNSLIADGARLVRGLDDILSELGLEIQPTPVVPSPLSAPPDPLLALLPKGQARSLDELVEASGRAVSEVLAGLGSLEARGLVQGLAGGLWLSVGRP